MSTISSLATYTKVTPNKNTRTQKVLSIIPHFMADNGAFSGKGCADYFYTMGTTGQRQCSSNYCIGGGGDIACSVPEEYRAWTSSSEWADQQSITIEVSCINNSTGEVTAEAWESLVALCADICKRYNITLEYTGDYHGTLMEHMFFASTNCPGPYLHQNMLRLAAEVNALVAGKTAPAIETGWKLEDGKWHYYNDLGIVWSEWVEKDGGKAYLKSNTDAACKEWVLIEDKWYYFGADGLMVSSSWLSLDGTWYYCKKDGSMAKSEWIWDGTYGAWYYLNGKGEMQKSRWVGWNGAWYYVKANGKMASCEWVKDDGKYYYVYGDGHMARSEDVDGHTVNSKGERID